MKPFFDDRVAPWVAARIWNDGSGFGNCRAMGVEHKGELVAGIVFHDWEPDHGLIEISGAADHRRWFTREVIRVAFTYVFDGLECQAVTARTAEDNGPVRHICKALGAKEYIIPRLRGRDAAGVIYVLTDEDWTRSRFNRS